MTAPLAPQQPEDCLTFIETSEWLHARFPGADCPTHLALRMSAYNNRFRTVQVGRRRYIPKTELPCIVRIYLLDYVPTMQLDAAD
jgi:hypothetical protein